LYIWTFLVDSSKKIKPLIQKDIIRDSIVSTAASVFSKYGFRKTTMDDIALAAGKGKSSIYYYFRNKEEIFEAVLEKEVIVLKAKLREAVNAKKHAKGKIKAYILTRMQGIENMLNFYGAVRNEYLAQFEFMERIRYKYDQEEIGNVQEILELGIKKGDFSIEDPFLASMTIVTSMKGFEIPLYIRSDKGQDIEMRVDKLLKMLFNGISTKK
jgi:AcrR family transcriptional regulator